MGDERDCNPTHVQKNQLSYIYIKDNILLRVIPCCGDNRLQLSVPLTPRHGKWLGCVGLISLRVKQVGLKMGHLNKLKTGRTNQVASGSDGFGQTIFKHKK